MVNKVMQQIFEWTKDISRPTHEDSRYWPSILNNPPRCFLSTEEFIENATRHCTSFQYKAMLDEFVEYTRNTSVLSHVEMVPRKILEVAKSSLNSFIHVCDEVGTKLDKSVKHINRSTVIGGFGIALILLGLLGQHLAKTRTSGADKSTDKQSNPLLQRISYASSLIGVACVAGSLYRMNVIAHYLEDTRACFPAI